MKAATNLKLGCIAATRGNNMIKESMRVSESVYIIKYNQRSNEMKSDNFKWKCKTKIEKYNNDNSYSKGTPDEVLNIEGNTALISGLKLLWELASGNGDEVSNFFFSKNNSYIGVGNSAAAASPTQTGLLGSSTAYQPMDQSTGIEYPYITNNTITFRSKFGPTQGNFTWNEWGVLNGDPSNPGPRGASSVAQLNRKVESMGNKVSGSTWVIVVDITINP